MTSSSKKFYSLYAGQIFPNYKSLCHFLEEDVKDGSSKRAQQAVWGRWFSWERDKHSYIIQNDCIIPSGEGLLEDKLKISRLARPIFNELELPAEAEIKVKDPTIYLQEGMVFKNYGCLCDYLQEDRVKSDSKEAQLTRWRSFFSWETEKHKITITEVFRPYEPFSIEWRYSIFFPACKLLLAYIRKAMKVEDAQGNRVIGSDPSNPWKYGPRTDFAEIVIFPKHLYKVLGFHGGKWKKLKEQWYWQTELLDNKSSKLVLDAVSQAGNDVFRQELLAILDNLSKRHLLHVSKTFLIHRVEDGEAPQDGSFRFYLASEEEDKAIKWHKEGVLVEFSQPGGQRLMTEYQVHQKGKASEFYAALAARLKKYCRIEKAVPVLALHLGELSAKGLEDLTDQIAFQNKQREEQNAKLQPRIESKALKMVEKIKGAEDSYQNELLYIKEVLDEVLVLDEDDGWG